MSPLTRFLLLSLPGLALAFAVSLSVGTADLGIVDAIKILIAHLVPGAEKPPAGLSEMQDAIVWSLRLPRTLVGLLVGSSLAIAGALMQGLFRNPLAAPGVIGTSAGASTGAVIALATGLADRSMLYLPLFSILSALLSLALVVRVARREGRVPVPDLLLAGVALAAFMAAISAFVTLASPDANKTRAVLFWLMGSFNGVTWSDLPLAVSVTVLGGLTLFALARPLDALLSGEESASSLGVQVESLKKLLIVLSALVTGVLVSISGAIGFVGLIIPHSVRSIMGISHRWVLPGSFLTGGLFMVLADTLSQWILPGQQLPVGIVTALCGVPFFLMLLRRTDYQFK